MKARNSQEQLALTYAYRWLKADVLENQESLMHKSDQWLKADVLDNQASLMHKSEKPSQSKYDFPKSEMDPQIVYRIIHDELELNTKPTLNMATFVNTWMEDEAQKLAMESIGVNLIDQSIYPMTTEIQKRIVSMLARKLGVKKDDYDPTKNEYIGTTTIGSSEAVMLAILAHKTRWMENCGELSSKPSVGIMPNLVIGAAYQVCWEKVYKFFNIAGYEKGNPQKSFGVIPLEGNRRVVTSSVVKKYIKDGIINDNTAALGLMLGTTLTGEMDEIIEINQVIKEYNDKNRPNGLRLPIHIDAAYGGFVLPFTEPDFAWDFRASEVMSINISNHKFGLVYPGLGTVIFRDRNVVPESLFTEVDYLGSKIRDYALNFSRASSQVICQYYNFLRLGESGYEKIMHNILENASLLANGLLQLTFKLDGKDEPYFELLTSHERRHDQVHVRLPNVVVKFNEKVPFKADALKTLMKADGWAIPCYTLPKNLDDETVLRMVVKENFSVDMVELFLSSMKRAIEQLNPNKSSFNTSVSRDTYSSQVIC